MGYISKTTANDFIQCCAEEISSTIKARVHEAEFYSVIFDETTDASYTSQLNLSLHYVYDSTNVEEFIGFMDLNETNYKGITKHEPTITGEILGKSVLKLMEDMGLIFDNYVGISCAGCSVSISEMQGAVSVIQKVAKRSSFCGCKNHAFNLSISKCNKSQYVRNTVGSIKEVASFYGTWYQPSDIAIANSVGLSVCLSVGPGFATLGTSR